MNVLQAAIFVVIGNIAIIEIVLITIIVNLVQNVAVLVKQIAQNANLIVLTEEQTIITNHFNLANLLYFLVWEICMNIFTFYVNHGIIVLLKLIVFSFKSCVMQAERIFMARQIPSYTDTFCHTCSFKHLCNFKICFETCFACKHRCCACQADCSICHRKCQNRRKDFINQSRSV